MFWGMSWIFARWIYHRGKEDHCFFITIGGYRLDLVPDYDVSGQNLIWNVGLDFLDKRFYLGGVAPGLKQAQSEILSRSQCLTSCLAKKTSEIH